MQDVVLLARRFVRHFRVGIYAGNYGAYVCIRVAWQWRNLICSISMPVDFDAIL